MRVKKQIPISELADVNIESVNKEDLVDAGSFIFDTTVPMEQRAEKVIAAVKNPYCFRVGEMGVKLEFSEDAPSLQDVFADFLKRKKSGL